MTKKVLAFGSFDTLHDGHYQFLAHAKALGSYLIVAVAPDSIIEAIKGRPPKNQSSQRIQALKNAHLADEVILADKDNHSWNILKRIKPNIIVVGFDQNKLHASLSQHIEQKYPDIETEAGWQINPKKPKIIVLGYFETK